jgi:hypothetical protein
MNLDGRLCAIAEVIDFKNLNREMSAHCFYDNLISRLTSIRTVWERKQFEEPEDRVLLTSLKSSRRVFSAV